MEGSIAGIPDVEHWVRVVGDWVGRRRRRLGHGVAAVPGKMSAPGPP